MMKGNCNLLTECTEILLYRTGYVREGITHSFKGCMGPDNTIILSAISLGTDDRFNEDPIPAYTNLSICQQLTIFNSFSIQVKSHHRTDANSRLQAEIR